MEKLITMEHGSGGAATSKLISDIFAKHFNSPVLNQMEDAAVVPGNDLIAMTTDSFVVTPMEFAGGNIGRLSVCGTVNDLISRGAIPRYLTCGFIIEEGTSIELLDRVVKSMAATANEARVDIVAGDTKVVEAKTDGGSIIINTAGVGFVIKDVSSSYAKEGDAIIVTGTMGDHHAAILSHRLSIENDIKSDNAPLLDILMKLVGSNINVRTIRDITRGGLATVLKELAVSSEHTFTIDEDKIPVNKTVQQFASILGLEPVYMGNEGKMAVIVPKEEAQEALEAIKLADYGADATIIGTVGEESDGRLYLNTELGGKRELNVLVGEGLPRIC